MLSLAKGRSAFATTRRRCSSCTVSANAVPVVLRSTLSDERSCVRACSLPQIARRYASSPRRSALLARVVSVSPIPPLIISQVCPIPREHPIPPQASKRCHLPRLYHYRESFIRFKGRRSATCPQRGRLAARIHDIHCRRFGQDYCEVHSQ